VIAQQQNDLTLRSGRAVWAAHAPQLARRAAEQSEEGFVEAAHAAKSRGEGDFGHRQSRLMNELLGEEDAPGLGNRHRGSSEMLAEQATQLPFTEAEAARQGVHVIFVQGAKLDQIERARDRV
jgi:hypothetical protein